MSLNISRSKSMALLAAVMMVTSGAALGVGTFSYFSGTGQVNQNSFTAGTIGMKLSEDQNSWAQASHSLSGTWGANKFAPGDTMKDKAWIKNTGSLDGNVLLLNFEESDSYNATFAKNINVWISFGNETNTDFNASMGTLYQCIHMQDGDSNWDQIIFHAWKDKGTSGLSADDLYKGYVLPAGSKHFLGLAFKFNRNAPNSLQGVKTGFNLELKTFHTTSPVTRGTCQDIPN